MNILKTYFEFEKEDKALDFIYDHLDDELKAGHYELVDGYLKSVMDNPEWWKKCIDLPVFSLSFAIYIHYEPSKFKNREEFMQRLYTDYVSTHGVKRADSLVAGLIKGIKMPTLHDTKKI
jgi:hypothetical protein